MESPLQGLFAKKGDTTTGSILLAKRRFLLCLFALALTGIAVAATPDDERKFELEGVG